MLNLVTKYKHTNLKGGTFSIKDSEGKCYALGPYGTIVLDKNNEIKNMILVEKITEERTKNINKKVINNDSSTR